MTAAWPKARYLQALWQKRVLEFPQLKPERVSSLTTATQFLFFFVFCFLFPLETVLIQPFRLGELGHLLASAH